MDETFKGLNVIFRFLQFTDKSYTMKKKKKSLNIAIIRVLFDLEKIIISNKVSTSTRKATSCTVPWIVYSNEKCSVKNKKYRYIH